MKLILIILFSLFCQALSAQQYWMEEYDLDNKSLESGRNCVLYKDKIIITGGSHCNSNSTLCHKFTVLDTFGNLEYYTTYDSLFNRTSRGLIMHDNTFISVGTSVRSSTEIAIIAQDVYGEVIQTRFIANPYDSNLTIEPKLILDFNAQEFLFFADIYGEEYTESPSGTIDQIGVFIIDKSTFDVRSTHIIKPVEYITQFMDAKIDSNNIYVATDQRILLASSGKYPHYSQLLKYNSDFLLLDSMMTTENNSLENNDRIAVGKDGRIVMSRKSSKSFRDTDELYIFDFIDRTIIKKPYDILSDPYWNQLGYNYTGMKNNSKGDIYVYGNISANTLDYTTSGYLAKLDANFDIDWERVYITNVNEIESFDLYDGWSDPSYLYDVFLVDKSIVISGYINNSFINNNSRINNYNLFVGKFNLRGCQNNNCEVEHYKGGSLTPDHLVQPGKTWHIFDEYRSEVYRYQLSEDSFYIEDRYYLQLLRSDSESGDDFYSTGMYMRERSHFVYLRRDNEDLALYDFDMGIGGRIKSWIYERFEASHELVERDSVFLENGEYVRREKLRCSIDQDAEEYGYYHWIQGVGDTKGLLAIEDACIEDRESHLLCVYDKNGILLWDNPDFDDCWLTVNTHDTKNPTIDIIFDTATSNIKVTHPEKVDLLQIVNAAGQVTYSRTDISSIIDVDFLLTGLYFVTVVTDNQIFTKKIIKL